MRRFVFPALAAATLLAPPAPALRIAVMPAASTRTKTLQAEAVVVGKVVSIEKETVDLPAGPNQPKVPHLVANLKIETALAGVKNITHLKLAIPKPPEPGQPQGADPLPGRPIGRPVPFPGGTPAYTPAEEHEGVFFLQKHPGSDNHYTIPFNHNPLLATDPKYKDELAAATVVTAALADPVKALSAAKGEDRLAAALALAQKYRFPANNQTGVFDESPIPAEQTKLFLKALADADWATETDASRLADALGLVPGNHGIPRVAANDGESSLATRQKAFKAWLDKFGGKFEVKQLIAKPAPQPK
ncbi:MAG: hypothetical protein MUF18_12995 [Fimbriiglobus sp.]|nr:hypothetical protein [Fimbriiglobus sp.]